MILKPHYIILISLLLACSASAATNKNACSFKAENYNHSLLELKESWQFYSGGFLTAEEMKQIPDQKKIYIPAIQNWKKFEINGHKLSPFGTATYYKQIIITPQKQTNNHLWGIRTGAAMGACRLWVNHILVGEIGKVDSTKKNFRPRTHPTNFYFTSNTDTLEVILHVSNFFSPDYAGIVMPFYFGSNQEISLLTTAKQTIALVILVTFLVFFMYQLTLSFFENLKSSHLILALISLILFVKAFMDGGFRIADIDPTFNYILQYKIWTLSLLSFPAMFRLVTIYFPNEINRTIEKCIYLFYGIFCVIVFTTDIAFQQKFVWLVLYASVAIQLYELKILIVACFKHRAYAVVQTISFFLLIFFCIYDLISTTQLRLGKHIYSIAALLFILLQSTLTSIRHSKAQQQVHLLSDELKDINKHLENKVVERTTELKLANQKLSEVNKQKDILIATISHDLVNSFNTLLVLSNSLINDCLYSIKQHYQLKMMNQAASKGYYILETLLSWTKLQNSFNPHFEKIERLSEIVEENILLQTDLIQEKELIVNTDIDNNLTFICDMGHLNTIIRNLLLNAIKFNKFGGSIRLSTRKEMDHVQIIIQDNGIGMPDDLCKNLFSSDNHQTREGTSGEVGNGIGLLIIKDLVESNQGKITCNSTPEEGCQFILEFKLL